MSMYTVTRTSKLCLSKGTSKDRGKLCLCHVKVKVDCPCPLYSLYSLSSVYIPG